MELRAGTVYINGEPIDEPYLTRVSGDDFGPYQVGEDEVFVMGDNRPVSRDSRSVGAISLDDLYGRVLFVAYPFNEIRSTMDVPQYE